jgi:excinuclease ABC subunit B
MEADKEGFLRAERSLVQTIGRAARNVDGRVILYADRTTDSMARAMSETTRRRTIQTAYNVENNITPTTIVKEHTNTLLEQLRGKPDSFYNPEGDDFLTKPDTYESDEEKTTRKSSVANVIRKLEKEMKTAAKNLDFERAAEIRDQLRIMQEKATKSRQSQ